MVNLIVDVSRYLMILLIAVYTWLNFRYFSFRDEGKQKKICGRQNLSLIHIWADSSRHGVYSRSLPLP